MLLIYLIPRSRVVDTCATRSASSNFIAAVCIARRICLVMAVLELLDQDLKGLLVVRDHRTFVQTCCTIHIVLIILAHAQAINCPKSIRVLDNILVVLSHAIISVL